MEREIRQIENEEGESKEERGLETSSEERREKV